MEPCVKIVSTRVEAEEMMVDDSAPDAAEQPASESRSCTEGPKVQTFALLVRGELHKGCRG